MPYGLRIAPLGLLLHRSTGGDGSCLGADMPHPRAHFRHQRNVAPRPVLRRRICYIATAVCALLLGSCDWGPERWEPQVVDVAYNHNGQTDTLALDKTAPTLEINEGDHLAIRFFHLQMFPVQRTSSGSTRVRVRNLPPIHQSDLKMLVRVSATPRNFQDSRHCWDVKGQITTDWAPAEAGTWRVAPSAGTWVIAPRWDEIRINVLFRQAADPSENQTPIEEYTINYIILNPTSTLERIRTYIGQNIFWRIVDSVRGVGNCSR